MNFTDLSIKRKLTIWLFTAVFCSTVFVGAVGQWSARSLISERLKEVELPNILWQIRNQIDGDISQLQNATQQLASNVFIRNWLISGDDGAENGEQKVIQNLQQLQHQYDLSHVSVADRSDARYWNQNGFLRKLRRDQHDGWFYTFRDSGQSTSKSLYTENGVTTIFLNYQQLNGRVLAGVGRPLDQMISKLNSFAIFDSGFVFIANAQGQIQKRMILILCMGRKQRSVY